MDPIKQKIIKRIQQYAVTKDIEITDDTKLFEDLGYDSVAIIQLLVDVEELFGFESDEFDECMDAFESISTFVNFVKERTSHVTD